MLVPTLATPYMWDGSCVYYLEWYRDAVAMLTHTHTPAGRCGVGH
jgi:hypothetical protein